ncbi:hypothetical protein EX30DRAFT_360680 [Ascodesmis nigricans]|uniref:Uncharacterized protein n=1 Tax=Ascodesmis nigricans TaxID=341454 RepID=A0A4S2N614_9PEZI|nr:hypothetical protein EX30DRAFT_360680 [Ascodesmis nigricans]
MSTPLTTSPTPPPRPPSSCSSPPSAANPRSASPAPVPVFAPRPLRVPPHHGFPRSFLSLEPPRTPSPGEKGLGGSPAGGTGRATPGEETIRIYSPASRDALDDFFKVVRRSSPALSLREILGGWVANNTCSASGKENQDRPSSSCSSSGSRAVIELPSSPVSRNLTRNPIIFNSQFDAASLQRLKMSTSPMQERERTPSVSFEKNPEVPKTADSVKEAET